METDDGKRPNEGLLVCARKLPDGRVRLIMDVMKNNASDQDYKWEFETFYTFNHYELEQFQSINLTKEQLEDIGFNIVSRLAVIINRI